MAGEQVVQRVEDAVQLVGAHQFVALEESASGNVPGDRRVGEGDTAPKCLEVARDSGGGVAVRNVVGPGMEEDGRVLPAGPGPAAEGASQLHVLGEDDAPPPQHDLVPGERMGEVAVEVRPYLSCRFRTVEQ
ncbi:hypothetical protein ACFW5I_26650 [Streptomyces sp. NPDC058818]|uniref:hypothetical protein n=1 Tax=Streptomyces sp. NPDC058818 TaxID=3346640 RepID=UPI0036BE8B0D